MKYQKFYFTPVNSNLANGKFVIFLADYIFFAANQIELNDWCIKNNCDFQGMTVTVPDEHTLAIFILKWS